MSAAILGALAPIVERKEAEAGRLRARAAGLWAKAESAPPPRAFVSVLQGGAIIAEMKRRSPSGGTLRPDLDCAAMAEAFAGAGAAALSVLTDDVDFGGALSDMTTARDAVDIAVLRKDFVVAPVQVAEARAAGADGVLLIVAVLGAAGLEQCLEAARRCGIDALVEVHDAAEARLALSATGDRGVAIGVNNRDLRTLRTDQATFARLRRLIPVDVPCVAESGVRGPEDVARAVSAGADAVLVGEALMRAPDAAELCRALVQAGRVSAT
jgi:indole-3-glycerol phosphate synthase